MLSVSLNRALGSVCSALVFLSNSNSFLWQTFHYIHRVTTNVKSPIKCWGEINRKITDYKQICGLASKGSPSPSHAGLFFLMWLFPPALLATQRRQCRELEQLPEQRSKARISL